MRALQDDVYKYMQMQKQQGAEHSSGSSLIGMQQHQAAELQPPLANNYEHATCTRMLQQQAQKKDIKNDGSAMPLWVQGLTEIGSIGVGKRTVFLYDLCLQRLDISCEPLRAGTDVLAKTRM